MNATRRKKKELTKWNNCWSFTFLNCAVVVKTKITFKRTLSIWIICWNNFILFLRAFFIFRQLFHFHKKKNSYTTYKTEWNAQNRKNLEESKAKAVKNFQCSNGNLLKCERIQMERARDKERVGECDMKRVEKSRVIISVCKMQMCLRKVDDDN